MLSSALKRVSASRVSAALMLALLTSPGHSQLPGPREPAELPASTKPDPASSVLRRDPACTEASNTCQICVRDAKGDAACATPGIACQPAEWQCKSEPAPTAPTPKQQ